MKTYFVKLPDGQVVKVRAAMYHIANDKTLTFFSAIQGKKADGVSVSKPGSEIAAFINYCGVWEKPPSIFVELYIMLQPWRSS